MKSVRGLRIGYCDDFGVRVPIDKDIVQSVRNAAYMLVEEGATVEDVNPGLGDTFEAYKVLEPAFVGYSNNDRSPEELAMMDPGLVAITQIGEILTAFDLIKTGSALADWIEKMFHFFRSYDLLITPTVPVAAFHVGRNNPLEERYSERERVCCLFGQYLYPFNFTHHPSISVPCGLNKRGLPMGWQIVGPLGNDYRILVAARTFEMINPFPKLPQLSQQKPLQLQIAKV
ncbi:amidase family protein [Brevibacillus reuszeri]|uniref:amidase family protein n=1 Tax=Brevibacillus reuszeri TaxID=54915 RepID=UPI003D1C8015